MLQLWKFVLLCGLLTGTSANIYEGLLDRLENYVDNMEPVLLKAYEDIKTIFRNRETFESWQNIREVFEEAQNVLNTALDKLLSGDFTSAGLKISNVHILAMRAQKNPDGEGVLLRIPTGADVSLSLPITGQVVNLNVTLDVMAKLEIETDPKSGRSRVVMTDCYSDPNSISMSLMGKHNILVNKLSEALGNFLSKTVTFVVQNQICPLMRLLAATLDVKIIQNIINNGQPGNEVPLMN